VYSAFSARLTGRHPAARAARARFGRHLTFGRPGPRDGALVNPMTVLKRRQTSTAVAATRARGRSKLGGELARATGFYYATAKRALRDRPRQTSYTLQIGRRRQRQHPDGGRAPRFAVGDLAGSRPTGRRRTTGRRRGPAGADPAIVVFGQAAPAGQTPGYAPVYEGDGGPANGASRTAAFLPFRPPPRKSCGGNSSRDHRTKPLTARPATTGSMIRFSGFAPWSAGGISWRTTSPVAGVNGHVLVSVFARLGPQARSSHRACNGGACAAATKAKTGASSRAPGRRDPPPGKPLCRPRAARGSRRRFHARIRPRGADSNGGRILTEDRLLEPGRAAALRGRLWHRRVGVGEARSRTRRGREQNVRFRARRGSSGRQRGASSRGPRQTPRMSTKKFGLRRSWSQAGACAPDPRERESRRGRASRRVSGGIVGQGR